MYVYFGHGGEIHETATEATRHVLSDQWYIALPLYICILFTVTGVAYIATRSKTVTLGILLMALFVAGIAFYSTAPAISIVSLVAGFATALGLVLFNINENSTHTHGKNSGKKR